MVIPGYELLDRLGGGPLTEVFSAREEATDRPCAVKVLREEWQEQATAIKLIQREARTGLAVRHPHIVRLLDTHVTRAPYFLVLELLPGESLRHRLRRDYCLDLPTTLWIIRQTAEALSALTRAGFVHGDIKPDNIHLIGDGTATLIDLGFAHRPGENTTLQRQGYLLGTVDYLAPELCAFQPERDASGDMFSLGITFFEMLTGRLPYPPGSMRRTLQRHCCDPPADIRKHVRFLPTALITLLKRLLAHDPRERPRAAAVVQQLVALEIATLRRQRAA